jgi:signal transduction histidine kinase
MGAIYDFLWREGFQPHGFCMLWDPWVFWTHVAADGLIALSYVTIPIALIVLTRRRPDLLPRPVAYLFSAFILACGATHLLGVWTMWVPHYGLEGAVKAVTAVVSLVTAVALWPLLPRIMAAPSVGDYERKNAEITRLNAELSAALEAEKALNAMQRQFVAMVNHEMRTPLAVIDGRARQIARRAGTAEADDIASRSGEIRGAVTRLTDLIESVLQSARFEEGRIDFNPVDLDLSALVRDCVRSAQTAYADRRFMESIDEGVATEAGDATLLRQVVANLLSNAAKYSDIGTAIHLRLSSADGEATLCVRDEGVGVPPDELERIFDRFFRASTAAGRPGTGIGLHLVRHFVELHGGRVSVDSAVGRGSTFTIRLPLTRPRESAAA